MFHSKTFFSNENSRERSWNIKIFHFLKIFWWSWYMHRSSWNALSMSSMFSMLAMPCSCLPFQSCHALPFLKKWHFCHSSSSMVCKCKPVSPVRGLSPLRGDLPQQRSLDGRSKGGRSMLESQHWALHNEGKHKHYLNQLCPFSSFSITPCF